MDKKDPLQRLSALLSRLPGIGEKSALRLSLSIVRGNQEYAKALSEAVLEVHSKLDFCSICGDLSSQPICERCYLLDMQYLFPLFCLGKSNVPNK